ncbi:hypothetical protein L7F22_001906 [Adiantum nelumboides]|nr:hypothetical protein [Adiantum nelumboides]
MTHYSSQQQAYFLPTKMPFPAKVNGISSKSSSHRPPRLLKAADLARDQDLGAEQFPSCYDDDYNDEASLESTNTVSVYGNPLWADDQTPYYSKGNVEIGTVDSVHHGHPYHNYNPSPEGENGALPMLALRDRAMYTSDSSDGGDAKPLKKHIQNTPFWRARMYDVDSRSTSQSSSNFDVNSMFESGNLYEQQASVQGNLRTSSREKTMCLDIQVLPEQEEHISEPSPRSALVKRKGLLNSSTETSLECSTDLKKDGSEHHIEASQNPGRCKGSEHQHQQQYDLTASDGIELSAQS